MNKVLVIGDVIVDKYIYGTSTRISPEAPVPVITYINEKQTLGGAGLVHKNLLSLGVDSTLFETEQPSSIKTRVICDGHYITRIDNDKDADSNAVLANILKSDFSQYEYVILSDYDKGVLDNAKQIIAHITSQGPKVIVDPKRYAHEYEGAWLIKPNNSEFTKFEFDEWQGNIITTSAGANVVATIDNIEYDIPVAQAEVSDVTGAGDCFLATFVYALTKGYTHKRCLELSVKGATEAVKHVGTHIITIDDINDSVVWTNGVFDILHIGHLKLLRHAHTLGKHLVVGINSDASVKRLKGDLRPINNEQLRKEALLELGFIDEVVIFDEDTPQETLEIVRPDIIVKGGDYTVATTVGNELAEVVIFPTVDGHSTTNLIERMT